MAFQIKNTFQCAENWDNMSPSDLGRFCNVCQKEVIDFTQFTKDEITDFFRNTRTTVCGRMTNLQLQTIYIEDDWQQTLAVSPFWKRFLFVWVICFGPSLLNIQFSFGQDSTLIQQDSIEQVIVTDSLSITNEQTNDSLNKKPSIQHKKRKKIETLSVGYGIAQGNMIPEYYYDDLMERELKFQIPNTVEYSKVIENETSIHVKQSVPNKPKRKPTKKEQPDIILTSNPLTDKRNKTRSGK